MKVAKRNEEAWALTEHVTRFFNSAFNRNLGPSRAIYDAVVGALEAGYSRDELRVAFWVARCVTGDAWMKDALQNDMFPDIVLRFKGGMNTKTGVPAKRWLDELTSRAGETNPVLVGAILDRLPPEMRAGEVELLTRNQIVWHERGDGDADLAGE